MEPLEAPPVSLQNFRPCSRYGWQPRRRIGIKAAHSSPGTVIIGNLPKPVKNACLAQEPNRLQADNEKKYRFAFF